MSTDYNSVMAAVAAQLATVAPARVITRNMLDFAERPAEDLALGIFTLLSGGVNGYPYETSDRDPTDFGRQRITLIGQIELAESASGQAIEAAEFALVNEVEAMMDSVLPDTLAGMRLVNWQQSMQMERPYGWVVLTIENYAIE